MRLLEVALGLLNPLLLQLDNHLALVYIVGVLVPVVGADHGVSRRRCLAVKSLLGVTDVDTGAALGYLGVS